MPHFSRLTDIVTCNLTEILKTADDPVLVLREIIAEMAEGLAACRRTVQTSVRNHERISREIQDYRTQIAEWIDRAKQSLNSGDEVSARESLTRKVELEGLIAGLLPESEAAQGTSQHMLRIQKALEARHSDASRRLSELTGEPLAQRFEIHAATPSAAQSRQETQLEVEAELEALRRELGR